MLRAAGILVLLCMTGLISHGEPLAAQPEAAIHQVPVIAISYFPREPGNVGMLDDAETGWTGFTVDSMQSAKDAMITAMIDVITDATRFHGYKDPAAPPFLTYEVLLNTNVYEAMPRGYQLDPLNWRPHYRDILHEYDICDWVDSDDVREVWIYGYHHPTGGIVPDESKMSGPYGDISNAWPKDEWIPEEYRLPRCGHSYVLYNFTYQPGGATAIGNTVHNRMHQLENVVFFAEGRGYPASASNVPGSIFWDNFSDWGHPQLKQPPRTCGNTHSPPNTTAGYDYTNPASVLSNCEDWNPNPGLSTYQQVTCATWGCSDVGYYRWFMQNVPGYENGIEWDGKRMLNWWGLMYDFEGFLARHQDIYELAYRVVAPGVARE